MMDAKVRYGDTSVVVEVVEVIIGASLFVLVCLECAIAELMSVRLKELLVQV